MKRQFSRRRSSGISIWAYSGAILLVVLILLLRVVLPGVFVTLTSPFWNLGTALSSGTNDFFAGFTSNRKIVAENTTLSTQVATLTNEDQVLTARTEDLTKLLGGQSSTTAITAGDILAGVLARPPESPYDTLTLSAGSSDGIIMNAIVYSSGGIPIGTISQSQANSSQVSLFSTPGRSVSGWVGVNRIPVTLTGMGGGAFSATVTASTTVSVGDTVYLPGPGALPIGTVVRVETDPSSPTPIIDVQPLVDLFSITWVEVARVAS
jgi:cell shape-determining protein MreC